MPLLTEVQKTALEKWYSQSSLLDAAMRFLEYDDWMGLEQYIHQEALIPTASISSLPDFMRNERGETLFAEGLNPATNLEGWQDAIEVGWRVMEAERGISQERVHQEIARIGQNDWDDFMRRAEERKKQSQ